MEAATEDELRLARRLKLGVRLVVYPTLLGLNWQEYVETDPRYLRPAEVDLLLGDPGKAKRILNWEAKVRFKELVRIMVDADLELFSRAATQQHLGRLP